MNKKCSKYEGLFIFSDEETLLKHLEECPDCRAEHEKMQKVSELIGETKFYYKSKSKKTRKLKAICMLVLFMFFTATFGVIHNSVVFIILFFRKIKRRRPTYKYSKIFEDF